MVGNVKRKALFINVLIIEKLMGNRGFLVEHSSINMIENDYQLKTLYI